MDNIYLVKTDEIEDKIQKILRQTDYSEEVAREKLKKSNFDELKVIKEFFGINDTKQTQIKSVNHEIYKQLRIHLDASMRDYRLRIEKTDKII